MNAETESTWKIMTVVYFKGLSGKNIRSKKERFRTMCAIWGFHGGKNSSRGLLVLYAIRWNSKY